MLYVVALTVILGLLAIFQLTLALGAPLGRFAWGGQHRVLPGRLRIASAVTIVIYAIIANAAWNIAGVIDTFGDAFSQIAMWVSFFIFVFGVLANASSKSKPERNLMVPVSVVLAMLSFLIAMGYGGLPA